MKSKLGNLLKLSVQNIVDYILVGLNLTVFVFIALYLSGKDSAATDTAGVAMLWIVLIDCIFAALGKHKFKAYFLNFNIIVFVLAAIVTIVFGLLSDGASRNALSAILVLAAPLAAMAFFFTDMLFFERKGRWAYSDEDSDAEDKNAAKSKTSKKCIRLAKVSLIIWSVVLFGLVLLMFGSAYFDGETYFSYLIPNTAPMMLLIFVIALIKTLMNAGKVIAFGKDGEKCCAVKSNRFMSLTALALVGVVGLTGIISIAMPLSSYSDDIKKTEANYASSFDIDYLGGDSYAKSTPYSTFEFFLGSKLGAEKFTIERDIKYFTKDGKSLYADAYYPTGTSTAKRTVIIRMHGNGCDKGMMSIPYMQKYLASLGYVVFDIQYGNNSEKSKYGDLLSSDIDHSSNNKIITDSGDIHQMVGFFAEFLKYMVGIADAKNLDLGSVFLSGNSFGGYMTCTAGLNMTSGAYPALFPTEVTIKGLIPIYPWVGPDSDDTIVHPIQAVTADSPAMLLFMGGRDGFVEQEPAYEFKLRYEAAGQSDKYACIWGEYGAHAADFNSNAAYGQMILYYTERFIEQFK